MSKIDNKRRKLQHSGGVAETLAKEPGPEPLSDPRFQINSDFSDSEDGNDVLADTTPAPVSQRKQRAGSTPGVAAKATPAQSKRDAAPSAQRGSTQAAVEKADGAKVQDEDEDDPDGDGTAGDDGLEEDSQEADDGGGGATASPDAANGKHHPPSAHRSHGGDMKDGDNGGPDAGDGDAGRQQSRQRKKVLSKRKLEEVNAASDRRGIVYISRIPPHMKPHKLRQLLEPFGELGRVYCAPEDPALRRLRKKKGGNSGKNFTEGWVEFEDKRRAKRAALALNGQPMGGSKRSAYYYDLWTIKYLPKFKWDTLTEEINYQRAVREQRLVAEISAAKRERDFYLSRVDKAKAIDAIQERRRAKQQQQQQPGAEQQQGPWEERAGGAERPAGASGAAAAAAGSAGGAGEKAGAGRRFERHFGQRRAKADPVLDDRAPVLAHDVLGLLGRKQKAKQ